jgi:hypothetical protein
MIEPGGDGGGTGDSTTQLDPQQVPGAPPPPPSPLSGCYLLIVIGEPHSPEHKEIILQRLAKGRTSHFIRHLCRHVWEERVSGCTISVADEAEVFLFLK